MYQTFGKLTITSYNPVAGTLEEMIRTSLDLDPNDVDDSGAFRTFVLAVLIARHLSNDNPASGRGSGGPFQNYGYWFNSTFRHGLFLDTFFGYFFFTAPHLEKCQRQWQTFTAPCIFSECWITLKFVFSKNGLF